MKRVAILLLIIFSSLPVFSQISVDDVTFQTSTDYLAWDASKIANDTVYWIMFEGNIPTEILFDFTYFNDDDAILDIYEGFIRNDSIYYNSVGNVYGISFPVTLVRATYMKTTEGDTVYNFGIDADRWNRELIGVYLDPVSVTSGNLIMITDR